MNPSVTHECMRYYLEDAVIAAIEPVILFELVMHRRSNQPQYVFYYHHTDGAG